MRECKHPRYTHRVRYPGSDGKRASRYFKSETAALKFAKEQRKETGELGTSIGSISEEERAALAYWRDLSDEADEHLPDLVSVLREYRTKWRASKASRTVKDAIDVYISHQAASGASKRHLASLRSRLGRFRDDHGAELVSSITIEVFTEWLDGLRARRADLEGQKLTATTRHNLSRTLRSFFSFAVDHGWSLSNPVPAPKRSKNRAVKLASHKVPEIMNPQDIWRFMNALTDVAPALVPFWALKFFAGIRDAEASRMDWSMIDLEEEEIHLTAEITKTAEPRTVQIEPNLHQWLLYYACADGAIAPSASTRKRLFKKSKDAIDEEDRKKGKKADFTFPNNAARHCFGTYHLYHFRDAGETALQLGHKGNPAMLHEHYKNPKAQKLAAKFWEIYPEQVADNVTNMKSGKEAV